MNLFEINLKEINGYSNEYWGWGAEDDDLSNRVRTFYKLKRVPRPYDKVEDYHSVQVKHSRDKGSPKNPQRVKILKKWKSRWQTDGINVSHDTNIKRKMTFLELEIRPSQ